MAAYTDCSPAMMTAPTFGVGCGERITGHRDKGSREILECSRGESPQLGVGLAA